MYKCIYGKIKVTTGPLQMWRVLYLALGSQHLVHLQKPSF